MGTRGSIAREFQTFLRDMCVATVTGLCDTTAFKAALCASHPNFGDGGQHDAHEVLSVIIDRLHEDLSRLHYDSDGLTPRSKALKSESSKPLSPIGDLFFGQFISAVNCPGCSHRHESVDQFMTLSLPVPQYCTGPVSLGELITELLRKDKLDQDNMWLCPQCQTRVRAFRETAILSAPPALVVHLKRFQASRGVQKKVNTLVDFPDSFDMGGFSRTATGMYKLLGVVMHGGGLSSGHYTAAAIDPVSGKWYQFNDTNVSPASDQIVHSARAYLLFYQKFE
jgi:ubiquitin C-terminal hydrolase